MKSSSLQRPAPSPASRRPESWLAGHPHIGLQRSRLAMLWLTLVGVAAAGACWLLPWPPWVSAVATLATMVWYLGSLHRHALAGGPARGLRWAGGWEVRDGRQWQPAQLCAAVVWPPMVFLRLRGPAGIISFWLLPDRVEPHLLRRLRVTLRHPPPIRR